MMDVETGQSFDDIMSTLGCAMDDYMVARDDLKRIHDEYFAEGCSEIEVKFTAIKDNGPNSDIAYCIDPATYQEVCKVLDKALIREVDVRKDKIFDIARRLVYNEKE